MATAVRPHTPIGRWSVLFGGLLLIELAVTVAVGAVYAPAQGMAGFLMSHLFSWGTTAALALILGVIGLLHYAERSVANAVTVILGFLVVATILAAPTYY